MARTAKPGREPEAKAWLDELVQEASLRQGFVQCDVQPPGPQHPDEWVVVYEFTDQATLSAWLESPTRTDRIGAEKELFAGVAREQILATRTQSQQGVTAVSSFRLRPDAAGATFDAAYAQLRRAVESFDGSIQCELFAAEPGLQDETIVVFSFDNRTLLDRWLNSPERIEAMAKIDPLLLADRTTNVIGGFAGWFANPSGSRVRTWKQAALVLVALYPTALAVGFVRDLFLPDLAGPVATFISNAVGVAILSWLVMPPLTRRFADWLRR